MFDLTFLNIAKAILDYNNKEKHESEDESEDEDEQENIKMRLRNYDKSKSKSSNRNNNSSNNSNNERNKHEYSYSDDDDIDDTYNTDDSDDDDESIYNPDTDKATNSRRNNNYNNNKSNNKNNNNNSNRNDKNNGNRKQRKNYNYPNRNNSNNSNNNEKKIENVGDVPSIASIVESTGIQNKHKKKQRNRKVPIHCDMNDLDDGVLQDMNDMGRDSFLLKHGVSESERIAKQMNKIDRINKGKEDKPLSITQEQAQSVLTQTIKIAKRGGGGVNDIKIPVIDVDSDSANNNSDDENNDICDNDNDHENSAVDDSDIERNNDASMRIDANDTENELKELALDWLDDDCDDMIIKDNNKNSNNIKKQKEKEKERDKSDQNDMNIHVVDVNNRNEREKDHDMTNIDVNIMHDMNNSNNDKKKQGDAGGDTLNTYLNQLLEKYKTIDRSSPSDILSIIDETHIFIEQSSNNVVDAGFHDVLKLIIPLLEAVQSLVESEKNCSDNSGGANRLLTLNTSILNTYLNFLNDAYGDKIKEIKISKEHKKSLNNLNHFHDFNDNFGGNALLNDIYDYSLQRGQRKQFGPSRGISYKSSNARARNDPYYVSKPFKNIDNDNSNNHNGNKDNSIKRRNENIKNNKKSSNKNKNESDSDNQNELEIVESPVSNTDIDNTNIDDHLLLPSLNVNFDNDIMNEDVRNYDGDVAVSTGDNDTNNKPWPCNVCTYINDSLSNTCQMCKESRKNNIGNFDYDDASGNKENNKNENDCENMDLNNIFDISMNENDDYNENDDLVDYQNIHQHSNNNNANKSNDKNTVKWKCGHCRFKNSYSSFTCKMCAKYRNYLDDDSSSENDNENEKKDISTDEIQYQRYTSRAHGKSKGKDKNNNKNKEKNKEKQQSESDNSDDCSDSDNDNDSGDDKLKIKFREDKDIIYINKKKVSVSEIIHDYKKLSKHLPHHVVVKDLVVGHKNKIVPQITKWKVEQQLYFYWKLREFIAEMESKEKTFKNGRISSKQWDLLSQNLNIGRSGKALSNHFRRYSSVEFKTEIIGKLFSPLLGIIAKNTHSKSSSTSYVSIVSIVESLYTIVFLYFYIL